MADNGRMPFQQCLGLLCRLCDGLAKQQIDDPRSEEFGALTDPACGVLHTRAGEAVYPFAIAFVCTGEDRYLRCALDLGNWLVSRQGPDGSWLETPGTWRGTTTDQLLALCGALPALSGSLGSEARRRWMESIRAAADFLAGEISEATAHLNYCATTAASLAAAFRLTGNARHAECARALARRISREKIDSEGFIVGEGHREDGVLYGVDPGYNLDMTLWGLALYARLSADAEVEEAALRSLRAHLPLVYPDGSIDNSWGVRSNKWTTYGSKTAHGAQASFAILSGRDERFTEAALRSLRYLEGMVRDGFVGYGPQWWERETAACIYPTFTRASNLALAIEHGAGSSGPAPASGVVDSSSRAGAMEAVADGRGPVPLPCDAPTRRLLPTVGVALVRTRGLMATVTAYGYKAPGNPAKSKYMARPSGGTLSNLWFDGYGWLQIASQTRYRRWEPMHFPEAGDLLPLSPRIEQQRGRRLYSSLNEFDAVIALEDGAVSAAGVLRDEEGRPGTVSYEWRHEFGERHVRKEARLRGGWAGARVRIVEPVIEYAGTEVALAGLRGVTIVSPRGSFRLSVEEGDVEIGLGDDRSRYWWPLPALQGFPITIAPRRIGFRQEMVVRYILERTR